MEMILFIGHKDDHYDFFCSRIKSSTDRVHICVNDVFEYERFMSEGIQVSLSSSIPSQLSNLKKIVLSTGNHESKTQIVKKILCSYNHLSMNGDLIIITTKRTGYTTVIKTLKLLACEVEKQQYKDVIVLSVKKTSYNGINTNEIYAALSITCDDEIHETILNTEFVFSTEASLFSRERIDRGSLFLLHSVSVGRNDTILDYGCGYGVIGVVLAKIFSPSKVDFVDIKSEARDKTLINIELNCIAVDHNVFLASNLSTVYDNYSYIFSHFPIHVPTKSKYEMLEECRRALKKNGHLLCVIPHTFNFEKMVMKVFGNYKVVASSENDGYYIFETIKK